LAVHDHPIDLERRLAVAHEHAALTQARESLGAALVGRVGVGAETLDNRADKVWRQEGEIDQMSDAALGDALAVGDGLHGRPGLDLLEPAQGYSFDKRAVQTGWGVGEHDLGFDPASAQLKLADQRQRITAYLRRRNAQPLGDGFGA
jgi:hypothetical protein